MIHVAVGWLTLVVIALVIIAFLVGYVVAVARTPKLLAKMTPTEMRELSTRVSRYRLTALGREYLEEKRSRMPAGDANVSTGQPEPNLTVMAEDGLAQAREAALAFTNRTRTGGEP